MFDTALHTKNKQFQNPRATFDLINISYLVTNGQVKKKTRYLYIILKLLLYILELLAIFAEILVI